MRGQVVLTGDIPSLPLLVTKGDTSVRDQFCRATNIPDETLKVDEASRGIAHVFVFLYKTPEKVHPDLAAPGGDVEFDQKGCRFLPRTLVVRTNQAVIVKSQDPILHNTHTHPLLNQPQNLSVAPQNREGLPLTFRVREPVPVKVTCDIHPWMSAYWLVVDHPYATVTNERGEFEVESLPAGEHEFRVWHERIGWIEKSLQVTITAGETTALPQIEIAAERFLAR
jgi:hypothetical protein